MPNLFVDITSRLSDELVETLLAGAAFRVERIVSHGHASPAGFWYDQDRPEWVVVLRGRARLRLEGEEPLPLGPGDFLNIPARRRHRVEWTAPDEPTVWMAIHYEMDPTAIPQRG
jgi:cupin 2 domain-containing protein